MDKALAAEALSLYDKIDLVRAWIAEIQKPRKDRGWSVRLMGRNGYGNYCELMSDEIIKALATDEILDAALTPIVLQHARALMATHGARLEEIGFKKPDGCP